MLFSLPLKNDRGAIRFRKGDLFLFNFFSTPIFLVLTNDDINATDDLTDFTVVLSSCARNAGLNSYCFLKKRHGVIQFF
jgi:hypothetical protein